MTRRVIAFNLRSALGPGRDMNQTRVQR